MIMYTFLIQKVSCLYNIATPFDILFLTWVIMLILIKFVINHYINIFDIGAFI